MQNLQILCHHHKRMKQKLILLNREISHTPDELTLWQIIKIKRKIIEIELKTGDKVKVLANLRNDLVILVL